MLRPLTLTLIACLTLPAAAAGQFGSLTKKAKEKAAAEAAKAAGVKPAEGTLKFDNTMLELTPPVVNQVIAGLKVRANTKDPQGRNSAQVRQRANELFEEAHKLNLGREAERSDYDNKAGNARECRSEYLRNSKDQAMQGAQQKMMSPGGNLNMTFMTEYGRIAGEMTQAYNSGDTVKARKLEAEMYKMLGYDPKADSVKANAKCNMPPMPAWMAKADSVSAESTRMYNLARDLEEKSNTDAIKASGLTAEQFVMGVERATAYVAGGGGLWKFSKNEDAALKAASAQLKPLVG